MAAQTPMILYNLFPRLAGRFDQWIDWLDHIASMGFTWIYVNPFHLPGGSGSLYAVKDYFLYHPHFSVGSDDFAHAHAQKAAGDAALRRFLEAAHARGIKVAMDLVVNHTASDSPLVRSHPHWYRWKKNGRIVHPGAKDGRRRITWGDLAQLDHRRRKETADLRTYLEHVVRHYTWMGFDGFRCDAAYQVPTHLWKTLIKAARSQNRNVVFMGETLGCSWKQTLRVARAGFAYVFNGFRWWSLQDGGFHAGLNSLAQQGDGKTGSIGFPESHDTTRLALELHGRRDLCLQRYALAAFSSAGVMLLQGFEFGATRKPQVVGGGSSSPEPRHFDLRQDIAYVNRLKASYPVLHQEGGVRWLSLGEGVCGFLREVKVTAKRGARPVVQRALVLAHVWGGERPISLDLSGVLGPSAHVIYGLRSLQGGHFRGALVPGEVFVAVGEG